MGDQLREYSAPGSPDSSDMIAMVLEIIFGFFGILGMGWLYAGNIPMAIGAFVGFLVVALIETAAILLSFGLASCIIIPINLAVAIISGIRARDYVRNSGARGSFVFVLIGIVVGVAAVCGGFALLGAAINGGGY
ncbi:MAG: hypothetical protein OEZ02_14780 [Anaerolineae bacterium]|nr:hypothetical protein [Anaerolineae bacterium]